MTMKRCLLYLILAAVLLSSCSSEIYLAKNFVRQTRTVHSAVYFPEKADVTLVQYKDGSYSNVLDSLNQDAFLDILYAAYAEGLREFGIDVYIPDDPDDVQVDSTHWLILLTKVEIQGLYTDYVDHVFDLVDENDYVFPLNAINVASWFDINDGEWGKTAFHEDEITDRFSSSVTGDTYRYTIKPLLNDDIYNYSVYLGKLYAKYTFECMMNRYIASEMKKEGESPDCRLRYDPRHDVMEYIEADDGFIEF